MSAQKLKSRTGNLVVKNMYRCSGCGPTDSDFRFFLAFFELSNSFWFPRKNLQFFENFKLSSDQPYSLTRLQQPFEIVQKFEVHIRKLHTLDKKVKAVKFYRQCKCLGVREEFLIHSIIFNSVQKRRE